MKKTMKKAGYSNKLINKIFKEYGSKHKNDKKSIKKPIIKVKFFARNKKLIISFFVILILIIITLGTMFFINFCNDKECFIEAANSCESSSFTQVENTITVKYSTEDCILTKKIINLDNTEPKEVKDLFINLEMFCNYEKNNFDSSLIEGFSVQIDQCNGPLKDIVEQVRVLI